MLLADLVATSAAVAATRSRKAKVVALADALRRAEPDELEMVVSYLGGALRQRRTGLGWRGVSDLPAPADEPSLTVRRGPRGLRGDVARCPGPGRRPHGRRPWRDLFGRATACRAGVAAGDRHRQRPAGCARRGHAGGGGAGRRACPLAAVRRAAMLAGSTVAAAGAAFAGGRRRWRRSASRSGRPVQPMLASSAPDVAAAMARLGGGQVAIDAKLDGIRIQVHRDGDDVLVVTRSLDDITARLPEVVEVVACAAGRAVRARRRGAVADRRRASRRLPGHRQPHGPGHGRRRRALLLRRAARRRTRPARLPRPRAPRRARRARPGGSTACAGW